MKITYRRVSERTYEVYRDGTLLGIVQRSRSLPSTRGWWALLDGTTDWSPKRDTRKRATADLVARS